MKLKLKFTSVAIKSMATRVYCTCKSFLELTHAGVKCASRVFNINHVLTHELLIWFKNTERSNWPAFLSVE